MWISSCRRLDSADLVKKKNTVSEQPANPDSQQFKAGGSSTKSITVIKAKKYQNGENHNLQCA
jgi:hypothetical protein